jgi:DinB family protein
MSDQQKLVIKLALDAWNGQLSRAGKFFSAHTDEQLQNEVSPNRNTGVYLFGHLIAIHDAMLPLLGFGEKLYPELENIFIKSPDKSGIEKPPVKELRNYWSEVNKKLSEKFSGLSFEEWLQKHNAVSEEDFAKEPHRNKLNVLFSRTNHMAYHLGQLAFLKD